VAQYAGSDGCGLDMDWITDPNIWISLLTLTVLEIVLGIDNIVFISILAGKLPAHQQKKARQTGLSLALITRVLLLVMLSWIIGLTAPLFHPEFDLENAHYGLFPGIGDVDLA
jgi:predicted tellurium resistance membrane protein TerC